MGLENRRRELEREHQPRTMKAGGEIEARISRDDEQRLADEAREKQLARLDQLAASAQEAINEWRRALGRLDKRTYRDFDRIRLAVDRIMRRYGSADTL